FRFVEDARFLRTEFEVLRICARIVSWATPVPSAVSTCRKKDSEAEGTPGGMATCWYSVSVWVVPCPPSQASHDPACGGSAAALLITPPEITHGAGFEEPFSKPGLARRLPPPPPG